MANTHEKRLPALSLHDVSVLMKNKHPVHIRVFGVVSSDGEVMHLFKIKKTIYIYIHIYSEHIYIYIYMCVVYQYLHIKIFFMYIYKSKKK